MLHNVPILPETLICCVIFQSKCEPASVAGDSTKSRCDRKSFQIRPRSWDQVLFCGRSADTERWWSDVWEIKSLTKFGKSRPYFTKPKLFLSCLVFHQISFYKLTVSVNHPWLFIFPDLSLDNSNLLTQWFIEVFFGTTCFDLLALITCWLGLQRF